VAVAVGLCGFEMGSDVGGSIRIPSSFCGVFGHKPTYGLVPKRGPNEPKKSNEIAVKGPLARCAEDLALIMRLISTPPPSAPFQLSLPLPLKKNINEFKVVVWSNEKDWPVDDEVVSVVEELGDKLEKRGVKVERSARPSFVPRENIKTFHRLLASNHVVRTGKDSKVSLLQYRQAQEKQQEIMTAWKIFFEVYDFVLCPSYPSPAFPKMEDDNNVLVTGIDKKIVIKHQSRETSVGYHRSIFWPALTNVAHLPSTCFPCGFSSSGLPIGVNIVGKKWSDLQTIDFARLICDMFDSCGYTPPPRSILPKANL